MRSSKPKQQQVAQRKQTQTVSTKQRQIGTAFSTRMPRLGFSDIKGHTISWILGYVRVGDGTNGATDNVLLETAAGIYTFGNNGASTRGAAPILAGDSQLGATYVNDVEKHYARKRINKMTLTVASLQPSTANNMMCVISPSRAQGLSETSYAYPLATVNTQQPFTNVMSMDSAMTVDCWETKSIDITRFIGGGSGAKQNEFETANNVNAGSVLSSGSVPAQDLDGIVPACLIVSGNSTTTTLRGTRTHAVIITQVVDFIDFLGGSTAAAAVGVSSSTSSTAPPAPSEAARQLAQQVLGL